MAQPTKKQALGKGIRALLSNIDDELKETAASVPAVSGATNSMLRIGVG